MGRSNFLEQRRFLALFSHLPNNVFLRSNFHGSLFFCFLFLSQFELDFPNEYIVSVEGSYDKVFGTEVEVVSMLTFKANKRTSLPFGLDAGTTFEFYGKVGDMIHQAGVHVSSIPKSGKAFESFSLDFMK
ncbi:unnamed protein product [Microthlaspi erraticum]|uniref:Jacalin-type lectin domain-containing protein n=1 Tax=Microthlaspi erraticum TaxID=1685480 RepID=A0A6D2KU79_9BRAS|nr:unnamed protein product [Microthlaspi erraticum]